VSNLAGHPELLKEINRARLFEVLKATRVVSRAELARETNLSRTTISVLADELLRTGLVREIGIGDSTGGRPPVLLEFNPNAALALGARLRDHYWTVVVTNLDAQVVQRLDVPVDGTSPVAAIAALKEGVDSLMARIDRERLLPAIGLGTPGLVDMRSGTVKTAVDVGWLEVPIKDMAEEALGLQAFVVNRSKVGALAEFWYGAGQGVKDLIYVAIGTGIAAGIVHSSQLYVGANSSAGELGHVTVLPEGPACPCGNRGCLQQLASGPAIANLARARLREGGGTALRDMVGNHPELLTAEMVFQAAEEGDRLAGEIVRQAAGYLGIAIGNLINLFNPELVILGGSIGRAGQTLIDPLQEEVSRRAMAYPLSVVRIVVSALGPDAGAIGAAVLVLQRASELFFSMQ
jgi:glucokinase-like ROK family protein